MRVSHAVLLLVLLAGVPEVLAAQDPRLGARLDPRARGGVERVLDSAAAVGVPVEPLVLKALEGASKGADSARIVTAVRTLFTNLLAARTELGADAGEAALVAGAAALRAGAPRGQLGRLAALRPTGQLAVPLSVLADLLSAGISGSQAWSTVYDMTARGANDAALLALRDRLTGRVGRQGRNLPPPAEQPPVAPLPTTERPQ